MTDNMKNFLAAVSKDEALSKEFKALADGTAKETDAMTAAVIEFADKHGLTLTAEDFKPSDMKELTEDEMKAVAGGATCSCQAEGYGKGTTLNCHCTRIGSGDGIGACACVWEGAGGGW